jgi:hypothetical protein
MTPEEITDTAINPALARLPGQMDSPAARALLLATALQESRLEHRRQLGNGPARGFWQFEQGSRVSRGGVWGVYLHPASAPLLRELCARRHVACDPAEIWRAIEFDDILAAGVARLLIYTDPRPLPGLDDVDGAWELYAKRCWRPGKPHPQSWPACHAQARAYVEGRT